MIALVQRLHGTQTEHALSASANISPHIRGLLAQVFYYVGFPDTTVLCCEWVLIGIRFIAIRISGVPALLPGNEESSLSRLPLFSCQGARINMLHRSMSKRKTGHKSLTHI